MNRVNYVGYSVFLCTLSSLCFITIPFLALTAFILIAGASFYLIKATKAAK